MNDEPLFGSDSPLQLDSMDALQISMALKEKYGIEVTDSKKIRTIMTSINTLADFIQPAWAIRKSATSQHIPSSAI